MEQKRKAWRVYTLDDGSTWTVKEAAAKLECTNSTAYARLTSSTDPKRVFRPINRDKDTYGMKVYTLDDGTQWTARQVAKHAGIAKSTASTRLSVYTDPAKVLCPCKSKQVDMRNAKICETRMFFDPLGHWALINKNTGVNKETKNEVSEGVS
ncbi:MAG: hypothetical protein NZ824_11155 [Candidatus Thioglobus sp.]|nr:hypothetical protein [Candidatus Thioglobus sp.]